MSTPRSSTRPTAILLALGLLLPAALAQQPPALDAASVQSAAEQLYDVVERAVTDAGGNLDRQQVHLAFGFSTGHFAKDPVLAEAARAIATRLAAEHLVPGDRVSAYAWEMDLWPHKGAALNPLEVTAARGGLAASLQELWPRSPRAGSAGGHDTERAIAGITEALGETKDAVVVLLTNTAASVTASLDQRTVGDNDPAYRASLERWTRVRASSTSGATAQLQVRAAGLDRRLDAVVLAPKAFVGAPLPAARTELLARVVRDPAPTGLPAWAWPLIALAAIVIVFLTRRVLGPGGRGKPDRSKPKSPPRPATGGLALKVGDKTFPLAVATSGEAVCTVCGPGYPVGPNAQQYVLLADASLPPSKLVTVTLERKGLKLNPEGGVKLAGDVPEHLPLAADEHRVRLSGRAPRPNLPPRPFQADFKLALRPTE